VPRHRYFHAATEASSAADLLAASGDVLRRLRVHRSDKLFTFGFSQGGHAALALQRALEHRRVDVTATATVGGVLDVERVFLSVIADETTVTLPLYVAYILLAYDDVYDIYARPADVFRRPYAPRCRACSTWSISSTTCSPACRRRRGSSSGRRISGP
jgi:pimeloyl-ACP methyl ester carboxylesterase